MFPSPLKAPAYACFAEVPPLAADSLSISSPSLHPSSQHRTPYNKGAVRTPSSAAFSKNVDFLQSRLESASLDAPRSRLLSGESFASSADSSTNAASAPHDDPSEIGSLSRFFSQPVAQRVVVRNTGTLPLLHHSFDVHGKVSGDEARESTPSSSSAKKRNFTRHRNQIVAGAAATPKRAGGGGQRDSVFSSSVDRKKSTRGLLKVSSAGNVNAQSSGDSAKTAAELHARAMRPPSVLLPVGMLGSRKERIFGDSVPDFLRQQHSPSSAVVHKFHLDDDEDDDASDDDASDDAVPAVRSGLIVSRKSHGKQSFVVTQASPKQEARSLKMSEQGRANGSTPDGSPKSPKNSSVKKAGGTPSRSPTSSLATLTRQRSGGISDDSDGQNGVDNDDNDGYDDEPEEEHKELGLFAQMVAHDKKAATLEAMDFSKPPQFMVPFATVKGAVYDIKGNHSVKGGSDDGADSVILFGSDTIEDDDNGAIVERPTSAALHRKGKKKMGKKINLEKIKADDDEDADTAMFNHKELETFFGHKARKDFFYLYKRLKERHLVVPDRDVLTHHARSPRSEFISLLIDGGMIPWPILLRRITAPRVIDLKGMGLGDDVMVAFTKIMDKLPNTDTLLLADNRLTDASLCDICEKVTHMHNLTCLDISTNKMDDSSKFILDYLSTETCSLRSLYMEHSDIDDFECGDLMKALEVNKSLTKLDLRDNLIGAKEQLNVVMPELLTGGEAIAEMFTMNRTLTYLDVGWNSIRGDSAVEIAECLEENNTIKTLLMAHNAFGDTPSQKIGDWLSRNSSVTHLDMSYNSVSPAAAMVIANSFKTNVTLDLLVLNGNTIGKRGAEALMQALRRSERKDGNLVIEINNCDCEFEDPDLFDPVEPTNKYSLNMTLPYSRMVAAELLRMANNRPGAYFKSLKYRESAQVELRSLDFQQGDSDKARRTKAVPDKWKGTITMIVDELSDGVIDEPDNLNRDMRELLGFMGLYPSVNTIDKIMWSLDLTKVTEESVLDCIFRSVFRIVDLDGSGEVDFQEMRQAMATFSLRVSDEDVKRIIAEFDVDKSGSIEIDEFVSWMINQFAKQKEADKPPVTLNGVPWTPPDKGHLVIDFKADRMPPTQAEIGTNEGINRLINNIAHASTDAEKQKLFDKAIANSDIYMTAAQATKLMNAHGAGHGNEVETIKKLLPQLADPQQCSQLVNANLTLPQALLLRKQLGPSFGVVMGNASGRYVLDLENDTHRIAARKIAELNNFEKRFSKTRSGRGDTSQKGNWENFRNETLNHHVERLDSNWFLKVPMFGKLRFDYVSTTRPNKAAKPMSEKRFSALQTKLKLHEIDEIREWYDLWSHLDAEMRAEEIAKEEAEKEAAEFDRIKREFREARLKGAVVQIHDEAKIERIKQRKTANSMISSPAIDALSRTARKHHFLGKQFQLGTRRKKDVGEDDPEERPLDIRSEVRRGGIDASVYAAARFAREKEENEENGGDEGDDDSNSGSDSDSDYSDDESEEELDENGKPVLLKFRPSYDVPDFIGWAEATAHWRDYKDSNHKKFDYYGAENAKDKSRAADIERKEQERAEREASRSEKPVAAYLHAYVKLLELHVCVSGMALSVAQVLNLADHFPRQDYIRVQAIVTCHRCITDLENFQAVFRILDESETKELIHRMGYLNVWSPMWPDRYYSLDLRFKDHRKMVEMLSILAIEEPGENWVDEEYRWSSFDDPVPGWTLPKSWTGRVEDTDTGGNCGPRDFGRLDLEYTSDPNLDCAPVWKVRRDLVSRTLIGTKKVY